MKISFVIPVFNEFKTLKKAILEVPISIPHGLHGSWVEN